MLDDLRSSSSFIEEEEPQEEQEVVRQRATRRKQEPFLGMTAPQRFILSLLLFFMVCVLASFALILTQKVILPFL